VSNAQISETLAAARQLLAGRPIAARGVELWMETVTVAASARALAGEPPLRPDELSTFLEGWSRFINFWNDPP
jgi:hypothetical protein